MVVRMWAMRWRSWGVCRRGRFDRIGSAAEDRVTALNDRERVVITRESIWSSHVSRSLDFVRRRRADAAQ